VGAYPAPGGKCPNSAMLAWITMRRDINNTLLQKEADPAQAKDRNAAVNCLMDNSLP